MKRIIIFLVISLLSLPLLLAQVNPNHHYVRPYYRKDGTYVRGHYRTNPNHTNRDNYSTRPNVNPYTGKVGTIEPDNNVNPYSSYPSSPTYNYSRTPNADYTSRRNSSYLSEQKRRFNLRYKEQILYHSRYDRKTRKTLEQALSIIGFYPGSIDGDITYLTIWCIELFQKRVGLYPDGKAGPNTIKAILRTYENLVEKSNNECNGCCDSDWDDD